MNEDRISLTQEILVAFVDRELPVGQMAAVEAALAHDALAQETVRKLRVAAKIAKRVSADALDEPLPPRLVAAARGAPSSIHNLAIGAPKRWNTARSLLPLAAGVTALAIGLAGGYLLRDLSGGYTAAGATTTDPLAASYEVTLQGSLDAGSAPGQAITYESPGVGEGKIILGRSFSTSFNRTCREFSREEIRGGIHSSGDGLACRATDGSWSVMFFRGAS
jgi:hypothetical protein